MWNVQFQAWVLLRMVTLWSLPRVRVSNAFIPFLSFSPYKTVLGINVMLMDTYCRKISLARDCCLSKNEHLLLSFHIHLFWCHQQWLSKKTENTWMQISSQPWWDLCKRSHRLMMIKWESSMHGNSKLLTERKVWCKCWLPKVVKSVHAFP